MVGSIFSDIDPATTSGNQLATILNDFKDIVVSGYKGTTRPTNLLAGGAWIDEANDPVWDMKLYDGSDDITVLSINTTTNSVIITGTDDQYTITNSADSSVGPILEFIKKRTTGDQSLASDILGVIEFQGTDTLDVKYIQARIRSTSLDNTTNTTQGAYITFETTKFGTATLTEAARIDDSGNLGVGTAGPDTKVHILGTDATASLKVSRVQDIVDAPLVEIHKQRSTGSGQVLTNDEIGKVLFKSTDQNTAEVEVAKIEVTATENTTDTANGAKLSIQTKLDTTTTYQTALEVTNDQVTIPVKLDLTDDGSTDVTDVQAVVGTLNTEFPAHVHDSTYTTKILATDLNATPGTEGQVLKVNSSGDPEWGESSGGGGGLDVFHTDDFEITQAVDATTGNNATYLTAGTFQGTLSDDTTTPISKTSSIKYVASASSQNDWFDFGSISLDDKQKNLEDGVNFWIDTSNFSVDLPFVVWDITNAQELTSSLDFIPGGTPRSEFSTSFFIPSTCNAISYGFHMTNTPVNGESFLFDDISFSTSPFVYKDLVKSQTLNFQEAGNTLADKNLQVRFSGALTDADFVGDSILTVVDNSGSSRTDFSALMDCKITVTTNGLSDTADSMEYLVNGTLLRSGTEQSSGSFLNGALTFPLLAGEVFSVGLRSGNVSNTGSTFDVNITAMAETEYVITPIKTPRTYTETAGDFTITAASWTTVRAAAVYYMSGDQHRLKFNIAGTRATGASIGSYALTMSGVTFKNVTNFYQPVSISASNMSSDADIGHALVSPNTGTVTGSFSSNNILAFRVSGDVELESKPTWASDVSSNYLAATPVQRTAILSDVKSAGVDAGTFTAPNWVTRELNTISGDSSIVSLSSNEFTLGVGEYLISPSAPAYQVGNHQVKLVQDPSGSPTDLEYGTSERCDTTAGVQTRSFLTARVTLASSTTFSIEHECRTTRSSDGLGVNANTGVDEVYAQVIITKVK